MANNGHIIRLTCLLIPWPIAPSASAADFTGRVVRLIDGDTIEVLNGHHTGRIRLGGIDCIEKGQAFGKQAKHAVADLTFRKDVTIQTHCPDKRIIADVLLPDGTHVDHALVKDGWCTPDPFAFPPHARQVRGSYAVLYKTPRAKEG